VQLAHALDGRLPGLFVALVPMERVVVDK